MAPYRIPKRAPPSAEPSLPPTSTVAKAKQRGPRSLAKRLEMRQRGVARGYVDDSTAQLAHQVRQREAALKWDRERLQHDLIQQRARDARNHDELKQAQRAREAALAQARRAERWAQEHVHGEEGEILPRDRLRDSLRSKMISMGATPDAATRASIQVEVQQLARFNVNPVVRGLSILPVNTQVWYMVSDYNVRPAVITNVHSAVPPFYTVSFEEGGQPRETIREKLVPY